MKIVRTVKFAVSFPGWRESDLLGKSGLFYDLARVQGELTRAANQTASALYLVETGALPRPGKPDGSPRSSQSLAYQALSGDWAPFGTERPIYRPEGRRLCGGGLSELASLVYTRIKTDIKDIRSGAKSLATFREVPIPIRCDGVTLSERDGRILIALQLWGGRGNNRLTVAPVFGARDYSQREILSQILSGTYRGGNAHLYRDTRKGKWTLALSWTGEVAKAQGPVIAGLDLNILTTASIALVGVEDGNPVGKSVRIQLPEAAIRAWNRVDAERRSRQEQGRKVYDRRAGKGRHRKLRAIEPLEGRRERVTHSAVEETAAAVVRACRAAGSVGVAFEDLTGLPDRVMDESVDLARAARSRRRRFFLDGLLGALRLSIRHAAEREGLAVLAVPPAYTNRTCSTCGKVWKEAGEFGRVSAAVFKCSCGAEMHAHRNAALNIARRGRGVYLHEQEKVTTAS